MINFDLQSSVFADFSKNEVFTRATVTLDNLGREIAGQVDKTLKFVHIQPANYSELRAIEKEGYHIEGAIKIFAKFDEDILTDDVVMWLGNRYRVMKLNLKYTGKYSKFFAELLKDTV